MIKEIRILNTHNSRSRWYKYLIGKRLKYDIKDSFCYRLIDSPDPCLKGIFLEDAEVISHSPNIDKLIKKYRK